LLRIFGPSITRLSIIGARITEGWLQWVVMVNEGEFMTMFGVRYNHNAANSTRQLAPDFAVLIQYNYFTK
jgi:hypothetical protein